MRLIKAVTPLLMVLLAAGHASSNSTIESFSKAKKLLEKEVYFDHRVTLYGSATFNAKKKSQCLLVIALANMSNDQSV